MKITPGDYQAPIMHMAHSAKVVWVYPTRLWLHCLSVALKDHLSLARIDVMALWARTEKQPGTPYQESIGLCNAYQPEADCSSDAHQQLELFEDTLIRLSRIMPF